MQMQGVIEGKRITLLHETELPDGTLVVVDIQQFRPFSLEEKRQKIEALCGSWADDQSIPQIFAEIEAQRHASQTREVNFDAAS